MFFTFSVPKKLNQWYKKVQSIFDKTQRLHTEMPNTGKEGKLSKRCQWKSKLTFVILWCKQKNWRSQWGFWWTIFGEFLPNPEWMKWPYFLEQSAKRVQLLKRMIFKMRQCYLFQDLILPMSEFPFCTSPIIPVQLPFLPSDPKPPALGGRIRYVKFMACCNQKLRQ